MVSTPQATYSHELHRPNTTAYHHRRTCLRFAF